MVIVAPLGQIVAAFDFADPLPVEVFFAHMFIAGPPGPCIAALDFAALTLRAMANADPALDSSVGASLGVAHTTWLVVGAKVVGSPSAIALDGIPVAIRLLALLPLGAIHWGLRVGVAPSPPPPPDRPGEGAARHDLGAEPRGVTPFVLVVVDGIVTLGLVLPLPLLPSFFARGCGCLFLSAVFVAKATRCCCSAAPGMRAHAVFVTKATRCCCSAAPMT